MEITQAEKEITQTDIQKIEKKFSFQFPKEYSDHLLKYNGGKINPAIFSFVENGNKTQSIVDWFLAIYDGEYDNLEKFIEDYDGRIDENIIPIAHDPGANLICISCRPSDYGIIYFWNHEKEGLEDNYSVIANSFNEFLNELIDTVDQA